MSRQSCANCLLTIFPSVAQCTVENSVAKVLCFPISLGKYLVVACWLLDIQAMLHKLCVTVLRLPGLRALALESQTAILLGRIMSTNTSERIHPAPPWAGFTPLVSLSQTMETQAPTHHLRNILWGRGSVETWKTMQLAKKGGLR